jgi:hypothetical protein
MHVIFRLYAASQARIGTTWVPLYPERGLKPLAGVIQAIDKRFLVLIHFIKTIDIGFSQFFGIIWKDIKTVNCAKKLTL